MGRVGRSRELRTFTDFYGHDGDITAFASCLKPWSVAVAFFRNPLFIFAFVKNKKRYSKRFEKKGVPSSLPLRRDKGARSSLQLRVTTKPTFRPFLKSSFSPAPTPSSFFISSRRGLILPGSVLLPGRRGVFRPAVMGRWRCVSGRGRFCLPVRTSV